jgi:hypothetical protein
MFSPYFSFGVLGGNIYSEEAEREKEEKCPLPLVLAVTNSLNKPRPYLLLANTWNSYVVDGCNLYTVKVSAFGGVTSADDHFFVVFSLYHTMYCKDSSSPPE